VPFEGWTESRFWLPRVRVLTGWQVGLPALCLPARGADRGYMFAAQEITVEARFDVALARLTHLINRGALHAPSEAAYEDGIAAVLRVGPLGDARGLSKLVRVRWLEPIRRGATMSGPLRWEATGATGELFPVLDADLILAKHGDDQVLLSLTGSYRPPFGWAGAALDRAIMHRVAAATIQSLLARIADAVSDPAAQEARTDGATSWRPVIDPQGL